MGGGGGGGGGGDYSRGNPPGGGGEGVRWLLPEESPEGGTPFFGMSRWTRPVWYSWSRVLNRVYNFTIERLSEQGVFLDPKPLKQGVNSGGERSTCVTKYVKII